MSPTSLTGRTGRVAACTTSQARRDQPLEIGIGPLLVAP